jgi:ribose-phosphate pyrophosphokinase
MIKLLYKEQEVPVTLWKFPGGEVGVKISEVLPASFYNCYTVQVNYQNSDDIFYMLNIVDALKCAGVSNKYICVEVPYLPYARQDRVCSQGESFALEVFMQVLKTMDVEVWCNDIHSEVVTDKYPWIYSRPQHSLAWNLFDEGFNVYIAPDEGAKKKVTQHRAVLQNKASVVSLQKERVGSTVVYKHEEHDTIKGRCIVVDDICDGGATFVSLAEMLKRTQPNITELSLYVTHGIFSKGVDKLKELYDNIYTANLMNASVADQVTILTD